MVYVRASHAPVCGWEGEVMLTKPIASSIEIKHLRLETW
jgi:hypothetical protein